MIFILEVIQDGKMSRLTRSVIHEVYPVAAYPPRVWVKYCPSTLFDYRDTRKRNATVNESKTKCRCTGRV